MSLWGSYNHPEKNPAVRVFTVRLKEGKGKKGAAGQLREAFKEPTAISQQPFEEREGRKGGGKRQEGKRSPKSSHLQGLVREA